MPIVYLIFANFLIFAAALLTSIFIFKKSRGEKAVIAYGLFWFMSGITWLVVAVSLLVWVLRGINHQWLVPQFSYVFVVFSGPPLIYYLVSVGLKKEKIAAFFFGLYFIAALVFVFFLFKAGLSEPKISEWGPKYGLQRPLFLMLNILYVLPTILVVFDFFKRIVRLAKKNVLTSGRFFFSTLALLVYMLAGYFEAGAFVTSWELMLSKISILVSFFVAFLAYYFDNLPDRSDVYEV